ncbi:MAG TPA: tetratricopeptide repeat protein [Pyrinomonadaceae bacterium]
MIKRAGLKVAIFTLFATGYGVNAAFVWPTPHFPVNVGVAEPAQKYSPEMMRKRAEAERVIVVNKEKLRQKPDDVQAHKAIGDAYLFLDEYESAFNSYKEVLRVTPNDAEAYRGMGRTYDKVGDSAKALDFYKEAVRLDPGFGRAQADLGRTLVRLYRYKEAINPLKEGIRLKPKNGVDHDDYFSLGEAYLRTGQYQDAVGAYRKALEIVPGHVWTQAGLAEAHIALKQYDQAIASAKLALKQGPYDARTNRMLGDAYAGMHQYDKAIEYYKESIRVSPHRYQIEALLRLGLTYNRLGRHEEAVTVFEKGIQFASTPRQFAFEAEINPELLPGLYFSTAEANLNLGRGQMAADAGRKYIEIKGWSDPNAAYAAMLSYFGSRKAGRVAEAKKMVEEALSRDEAKNWPGPILKYVNGDLKEKDLFTLATDNDKMTEARAYVGLSLELVGRRDDARTHLEWVIKNGNREFIEYTLSQAELRRLTSAR